MAHDTLPDDCWSRTPHFRPGGKLTAEQLNASQADAVLRDRLTNVAMYGVGIAHGYEIKVNDRGRVVVKDGCIHLGCGLGFDRYGRMLFWRGGWISVADVVGHKPHAAGHYTLCVHYAEKSDKGGAFDPCHDAMDWVDRCVAFTLKKNCERYNCCPPEIDCKDCMTRKEWVCTRSGFHPGDVPKDDQLDCACETPPDLAFSDCGRVAYDPEAGLALSCIAICDLNNPPEEEDDDHYEGRPIGQRPEVAEPDQVGGPGYGRPERGEPDCDPDYGFCPCHKVESCHVRPVAYRNPLLYELINDADVRSAKIASYSWSQWTIKEWSDDDRVAFSDFKARALECHKGSRMDPKAAFSVLFSCPVQRRTLHPLSVMMDIYIRQKRPRYWLQFRVPIEVLYLGEDGVLLPPDTDEECVWGIVICPLQDWIEDELADPDSTILDCANNDRPARVEIILRGQVIRDCCGLMLDARPPEIDAKDPCGDRAGQAMVGHDNITQFRIGPDKAAEY